MDCLLFILFSFLTRQILGEGGLKISPSSPFPPTPTHNTMPLDLRWEFCFQPMTSVVKEAFYRLLVFLCYIWGSLNSCLFRFGQYHSALFCKICFIFYVFLHFFTFSRIVQNNIGQCRPANYENLGKGLSFLHILSNPSRPHFFWQILTTPLSTEVGQCKKTLLNLDNSIV